VDSERYELGPFVLDALSGRVTRMSAPVELGEDAVRVLVSMCRLPGRPVPAPPIAYAELVRVLGSEFVVKAGLGEARWAGPVRRLSDAETGDPQGQFEVIAMLGEGGMGQVWLVRHPVLQRRFALKVVAAANPHLNERILREARAQSSVSHPNVLDLVDAFEIDGRPALLLPYVEGPTFRAVLQRDPGEVAAWFSVYKDVVRGVAAIHAAGLVHRDLKPSNVLLDVSGPTIVPKVADFGVAKALADHRAVQHLTGRGVAIGTPQYAAPEQLKDAGTVDARADVWALGCLLHEVLTGAPPRRPVSSATVVLDPALSHHDSVWTGLLEQMLRTDPAERIADAAALLAALPPADGDPERAIGLARSHTPLPATPTPQARRAHPLVPDPAPLTPRATPRPAPVAAAPSTPTPAAPRRAQDLDDPVHEVRTLGVTILAVGAMGLVGIGGAALAFLWWYS
jgi:serine/threonine-protein kinase